MRLCFGSINSNLFSAFLGLPVFLVLASPMMAESLEMKYLGHSSILLKAKKYVK